MTRRFVYSSTGRQRIIFLANDIMEYATTGHHGGLPEGTVMEVTHSPRADIDARKAVWKKAPLSGKVYGASAIRLIIAEGEFGYATVDAEEYDGVEGCMRSLADWNVTLTAINRDMSAVVAMV